MSDAPLYPAALIGYRAWHATRNDELHSIGAGATTWLPGRNEAVCKLCSTHPEPPPASDCYCGLYAYHDLLQAMGEASYDFAVSDSFGLPTVGAVVGAVVASGRVEIHADGFRAERAQIIALLAPLAPRARRRVRRIGRRYGVPVFTRESDLRAFCERSGNAAPRSACPGPPQLPPPLRIPALPWRIATRVPRQLELYGLTALIAGFYSVMLAAGILLALTLAKAVGFETEPAITDAITAIAGFGLVALAVGALACGAVRAAVKRREPSSSG